MSRSGDSKEKFRYRHLPSIAKEAVISWNKDDPWRLSAIIAYYAILSLPGLLVIIIQLLSYIWGEEIVEGRIYGEIAGAMGTGAADAVQSIFESARADEQSLIATLIGIGALIFGATGVFFHLQISINRIFQIEPDPKSSLVRYLIDRTRSFGFVLIIALLLLVSFVISAMLSVLQDVIGDWFPDIYVYIAYILNIVISLAVISFLFALIFKYLPDARIKWKSVWIGAVLTAILFTIGKELLSFYFGEASPESIYGAAGSIIIVMLWVSYSSLIVFFGAEVTWVYSYRYGHGIRPKSYARTVRTKKTGPGKEETRENKQQEQGSGKPAGPQEDNADKNRGSASKNQTARGAGKNMGASGTGNRNSGKPGQKKGPGRNNPKK
jgi:membrane protein